VWASRLTRLVDRLVRLIGRSVHWLVDRRNMRCVRLMMAMAVTVVTVGATDAIIDRRQNAGIERERARDW